MASADVAGIDASFPEDLMETSGFAKFSFWNPMIIRIFGIHWKTLEFR
jgi:hypothetical protein